jgi:hypothetical protein
VSRREWNEPLTTRTRAHAHTNSLENCLAAAASVAARRKRSLIMRSQIESLESRQLLSGTSGASSEYYSALQSAHSATHVFQRVGGAGALRARTTGRYRGPAPPLLLRPTSAVRPRSSDQTYSRSSNRKQCRSSGRVATRGAGREWHPRARHGPQAIRKPRGRRALLANPNSWGARVRPLP